MIDTLRVQWGGIAYDEDCAEWLRDRYPTAKFAMAAYDKNLPWQGASWADDTLGTMGIKSNKQGNFLWVEKSLPKLLHGDNCRVLSVAECKDAISTLMLGVEQLLEPFWQVPYPRATAQVKRVDLCYQTKVACAQEVFPAIRRALSNKKTAQYLTGISLPQNKLETVRWYDKGFESGNERYDDVIRHEEQLRGGKAAYLLDVCHSEPVVNVDAARERMNARYEGWGCEIKGRDWNVLIEEHGVQGAAAGLLLERPDLEPVLRRVLARRTFYRVNAIKAKHARDEFSVDLTLPGDAWIEPMVL